jgi:hypothetical protein
MRAESSLARWKEPAGGLLTADRRAPPVSSGTIGAAAAVALVGAFALGKAMQRRTREARADRATASCERALNTGAAVLAASVVTDSALEHYRGIYANRAMYLAPLSAAANLALASSDSPPHRLRRAVFATGALVGTAGLMFHGYNILNRPGGLSWTNLFYAAPIAAPGALLFSSVLGFSGALIAAKREQRGEAAAREWAIFIAWAISAGLMATVAEVALLHFRGAYHDPFMYVPVTVPPIAAAALAAAALSPNQRRIRRARRWLTATAMAGIAGVVFHTIGIHRNMGGWRNWTQNLFAGPPLPAPPSFTGLAIAGMGVLRIIEARR